MSGLRKEPSVSSCGCRKRRFRRLHQGMGRIIHLSRYLHNTNPWNPNPLTKRIPFSWPTRVNPLCSPEHSGINQLWRTPPIAYYGGGLVQVVYWLRMMIRSFGYKSRRLYYSAETKFFIVQIKSKLICIVRIYFSCCFSQWKQIASFY